MCCAPYWHGEIDPRPVTAVAPGSRPYLASRVGEKGATLVQVLTWAYRCVMTVQAPLIGLAAVEVTWTQIAAAAAAAVAVIASPPLPSFHAY